MESDFQIYEMASDITCLISRYWKQVNEISEEGGFQGAEAKRGVRLVFKSRKHTESGPVIDDFHTDSSWI